MTTQDQHPARARNKRGEGSKLRAELIASASRLLETVPGEDALSLRAVAREAGVAAPSIYQHFADKHALVDAVLAERFAEFRARLEEATATAEDPASDLRARCGAYCAYAAEQPGNYRVMFNAIPIAADTVAIDQLPGAAIVGDVADSIGRCAAAGLHGPFDPFHAAVLLWAALHGIVTLRIAKPAFPWPEQGLMIDQVLHALCGLPLRRIPPEDDTPARGPSAPSRHKPRPDS